MFYIHKTYKNIKIHYSLKGKKSFLNQRTISNVIACIRYKEFFPLNET